MRYAQQGHAFGKQPFTMFWNINHRVASEATVISCAAGIAALWRYPPTKEHARADGGWATVRFVVNGRMHSLTVKPCPSRRGLVSIARRYVRTQVCPQTDNAIAKRATVEICGTFAKHIEIPCAGGGKAVMSRKSVFGVVLGAIRESKA